MKKNGFTLLELLIYISLVSIISLVLSRMFITINSGKAKISSKSVVDSNIRFAVEKINQDLRSATSITLPASAGATSTSIIIEINSTTITYDVSTDGHLRRKVNTSTPELITEDGVEVNTTTKPMVFTRLENNNPVFLPKKTGVAISIFLNIRYKTTSPDWMYDETKQTTILLR